MDDVGPNVANCFVDLRHRWANLGTDATVVVVEEVGLVVGVRLRLLSDASVSEMIVEDTRCC